MFNPDPIYMETATETARKSISARKFCNSTETATETARQRNTRGAMTGIVAIVALVIMLLGICFFFAARIMGGSRELDNITDSAVLNAAKYSLNGFSVTLPIQGVQDTKYFIGLGRISADKIDLLTYNRVVAQAYLVTANARELGVNEAEKHANMVCLHASRIGKALNEELTKGGLDPAFDEMASANLPKMLGVKTKVQRLNSLECAYLRPGSSTNVYIDPSILPSAAISDSSVLSSSKSATTGMPFLAGYVPIAVTDAKKNHAVMGVPLFPGARPHLINYNEFKSGTNPDENNATPPNAFSGIGTGRDSDSGFVLHARSCALSAAVDQEFSAQIPQGFIRIVNGKGRYGSSVDEVTVDGSNDLFNNELYTPNQIEVSKPLDPMDPDSTVFACTTAPGGAIEAWADYNATRGQYPSSTRMGDSNYGGRDPNKDPRKKWALNIFRYGSTPNRDATLAQLMEISGVDAVCTSTMYDDALEGPCVDDLNLSKWANNYRRNGLVGPSSSNPSEGFCLAEYLKADLLAKRGRGVKCFSINGAGVGSSGMKLFNYEQAYPITAEFPYCNFARLGTPWELMEQVGGCEEHFKGLLQRCREIDRNITAAQLETVLKSSKIWLGETQYLFCDTPGHLVIVSEGELKTQSKWADRKWMLSVKIEPDGRKSSLVRTASKTFPISGYIVNVKAGIEGDNPPDAGFHDQPYTGEPEPIVGEDIATWIPASGYKNLLGELNFEERASGGGRYSSPN
ncbi:MAG TPA: hypothetical protein V6D17_12685 [Candidatus Obscuribacterales bacterium]